MFEVIRTLKKFSVRNFKNFPETITFDLSTPSSYEFNPEVISNGCVTKAMIFGINGSGKSNFGLALFDIILHLTDKQKLVDHYSNYLNLNSRMPYAEFMYTFTFNGKELTYSYRKSKPQSLLFEDLQIDGNSVIQYDFLQNKGYSKLKGSETLNIVSDSSAISRVKFVYNNAILEDSDEDNAAFKQFMCFVERMLLFFSLETRRYQGFTVGGHKIPEMIIKSGHLQDFEEFLRQNGLDYTLYEKKVGEEHNIFCKFDRQDADLWSIGSTGTSSLSLFFFWYLQMKEMSLVFIDEFDAFYHYSLAAALVKLLKNLPETQVILTSHNITLMSNDLLRPDCYFLIDGKKIASLSNSTDKELRKAHNLQKMYRAGAFQLDK